MQLVDAVRFSEIILAVALVQQSAEFLRSRMIEKWVASARLVLAVLLFFGIAVVPVKIGLLGLGFYLIWRFRGPYCGGSDTMTMLVLTGLTLSEFVPRFAQEWVIGYVAFQLVMSYWQSGWVKLVNPEWRSGLALFQVFAYSAYPVSYSVRAWAQQPKLLWLMGWLVISFELIFPLTLINSYLLCGALVIAFIFHCANAALFGLNRFVLAWLSAYPLLLWLQGRLFS